MNDNRKLIVKRKPPRLMVIPGGVPPKAEPCSCGCQGVGVDAAHLPGTKPGPFFSFCQSCGAEGPAAPTYDLAVKGWNAATLDLLRKSPIPLSRTRSYSRYRELMALSEKLGRPKPP
jgi:3',5'-cyclic AMP phosphodiesterase CpdA